MNELPPLPNIPLGEYTHYKGNHYRVIGLARHSETLEPLVVYQALYGERRICDRPAGMYKEAVLFDGRKVPRFQRVAD